MTMNQPLDYHAKHFDLRHPDFNNPEFVYDVYERMREGGDLVYSDRFNQLPELRQRLDGHWEAIGYEICDHIVHDWEHFSSNAPKVHPGLTENRNFIFLDPPLQQQYRKLFNTFFSPRRIEQAEAGAQKAASELLDEMIEAGAGDLARLAWRLPGIVLFTEILGLPPEEVPTCVHLGEAMFHSLDEGERATGAIAFNEHVANLIAEKSKQPRGHSLIDTLFTTTAINGENLSLDEINEHAQILVAAGLETTSSLLTNTYYYLATRPGERDRLLNGEVPMATAIEEFFRFMGSVHGLSRFVTEDIELAGCPLKRGDVIQVNFAAANRDPGYFAEADQVVLDREQNPHLAFGAGPHRCLGSNLARMEFRVGVGEVLRRIPDYWIPDESKCRFAGTNITRGFTALPVRFTPGPRVAALNG